MPDFAIVVMALLIAVMISAADWLWRSRLFWIGIPVIWILFHWCFLVEQNWQVGGMVLGGMNADAMNGHVIDSWAEEYLIKNGTLPNWCPYYFAGMPAQGSLLIGGPQTPAQRVQMALSGVGPHQDSGLMKALVFDKNVWSVLKFSFLSLKNFLSLVLMGILLPLGAL